MTQETLLRKHTSVSFFNYDLKQIIEMRHWKKFHGAAKSSECSDMHTEERRRWAQARRKEPGEQWSTCGWLWIWRKYIYFISAIKTLYLHYFPWLPMRSGALKGGRNKTRVLVVFYLLSTTDCPAQSFQWLPTVWASKGLPFPSTPSLFSSVSPTQALHQAVFQLS